MVTNLHCVIIQTRLMHVYKILECRTAQKCAVLHFRLVPKTYSMYLILKAVPTQTNIEQILFRSSQVNYNKLSTLQILINYINSITPFFCITPNNINQFTICACSVKEYNF